MKKTFIFYLLFPLCLFSQSPDEYIPISNGNKLPDHFIFNPALKAEEFAKAQSILEYEPAFNYFFFLFYQKQKILHSGDIYMNDPITDYVNKVCDKLFERNQDLRRKVTIYITSYPAPNAFSFADGSVFINLGLFFLLENESQLAYIIAHEVSHFEKSHALYAVKKSTDLTQKEVNTANKGASIFRILKYSRENENEADATALRYMFASEYDANEAYNILNRLNNPLFTDFETTINIKEIFRIDSFEIDPEYANLSLKKKKKSRFLDKKDYDDLYETHPDIEKRTQALTEILRFTEYSNNGKRKDLVNTDFQSIKKLCYFEMIARLTIDMNYGLSLYLSLQILNKYPENIFLKKHIAINSYWLSQYKEIKNLNEVLSLSEFTNSDEFKRFYSFYNNLGLKESKKISYNFIKTQIDNGLINDEIQYYYALSVEKLLGFETSKFVYDKYMMLFPDGKYILTVKNKK